MGTVSSASLPMPRHPGRHRGRGHPASAPAVASGSSTAEDRHSNLCICSSTPLTQRICEGSCSAADATRIINDHDVDINARDESGKTALHLAVAKKSLELCDVLLGLGAFVDATDSEGETPLMCAVRHNTAKSFVALLITRGADINACNHLGESVFHIALKTGNRHVSQLLFNNVALHCLSISSAGESTLHAAAASSDSSLSLTLKAVYFNMETVTRGVRHTTCKSLYGAALSRNVVYHAATRQPRMIETAPWKVLSRRVQQVAGASVCSDDGNATASTRNTPEKPARKDQNVNSSFDSSIDLAVAIEASKIAKRQRRKDSANSGFTVRPNCVALLDLVSSRGETAVSIAASATLKGDLRSSVNVELLLMLRTYLFLNDENVC